MNPSSPIHLGMIVSTGLVTVWLLGACSSDAPAPKPKRARVEISAPLLTPDRGPQIGSLDAFGNLKGSGEWVLGFEIPQGAERNHRARAFPVMYVAANQKRLLRFYRSRGHTLIKTMTSWTVAHSHRSLTGDDAESDELKDATVVMTQGPGAGYTLRFHRSSPILPAKRPVELLVAAEMKSSRQANQGRGNAVAQDPPVEVKKLRSEAFHDRPKTSRAVDLSQRIYEHMKAKGEERFLD